MARLTRAGIWILAAMWFAGCPSTDPKPDDKPDKAGEGKSDTPTKPVKKAPEISKEAKESFARAVQAYRAQKKSGRYDYDDLLARFNQALEQDAKLAEAHYNLGCIYEAMREDKKAQGHYQKAIKLRPDLTLARANLGALVARNGKLDQALAIYQKALSKDAKNSPVLLNMAAIYQQQKKYDLALQKAGEVLVRDPSNLGAYRVMASAYYDMGKMDMARLICLRGLKLKEQDPNLLNTLGLTLLRLKKIPEALAQFRAALAQQPDMIPTRFNVAKVALDFKDFRVAREEFTKILEYEPSNKRAAVGLGIAMRGVGDVDAAKVQFGNLAKKYKKDPLPSQWLCRLELRNLNSPKTAKDHCKRCLKLHKSRPADDHPCMVMYKEATQGIEMEQKMKEMEKKALAEQKKYEEKMARLAKLRKDTVDKAWAKAKKECGVLPPAKLEGDKIEFVLDPLAVATTEKTKVNLVGYIFKDVKRINVGTLKVKWRQLNEHTLQMIVPEGLQEGPWDVLLTFKDKSEMFFGGGLWVGKKPKCEKEKPKDDKKDPKGADKDAKPGDKKGKPGDKPKSDKGPDSKKSEPSGGDAVQGDKAPKDQPEKAGKGKKETKKQEDGKKGAPAGKKDPKEAGEPDEPKEPEETK